MSAEPEARLVREALAGQPEAYSALVTKYQDHAYGVAVGVLADFDLARDVVQEAFLCGYRDLPKLRDPARFGGWLCGIVRHLAHRARRELERVRELADELGRAGEPFSRAPSPDQAAEEAERRALVQRALARLSDKHREAVCLYYVDGLSYEDIAGVVGETEAAVQGRLQRARVKLRKELKMVQDTFKQEELPAGFSAEIKRLLDAAAVRGAEHERAIQRLAELGAPAVDPLCEALGDPRIPVRRAAARALCQLRDARALRPLLRLLYSDEAWHVDVFWKGQALTVPGIREALLEILRAEPEGRESGYAVEALSYAKGDAEVYECLLQVFRRFGKRSGDALNALCRVRPEAAVGLLAEALRSADLNSRSHAPWLAIRLGVLPPLDACRNGLAAGVSRWGRLCAGNLILQHGPAGQAVLEEVLRTGEPVARVSAAMALARLQHPGALEILRQELRTSADRKWLKSVSQTVAKWYGEEALVSGLLAEPGLAKAPGPAWALARRRLPAAEATFEELLRTGTPSVRAAAVRALARQKKEAFLPALRACLRAGHPSKVAQEAFAQVLRLKDAAVPLVLEMLGSPHWTERKAAVCLLRRWGRFTPEQQARAAKDPHLAVRLAARD